MTEAVPKAKILVVDDDAPFRLAVRKVLTRKGYAVEEAQDGVHACQLQKSLKPDVVILDLKMPRMGGMELLTQYANSGPSFIVLTGHGTIETAVEAMRLGATSFLQKPFENSRLLALVSDSVRSRQQAPVSFDSNLIGESPPMLRIKQLLGRVAVTDETVLIMGETGTGKELAARTIHEQSHRSEGPFVAVNCACIGRELFESELFGHVKGAFTGATEAAKGLFRQADSGTLFIDEVGELPLDCQAKLLRVLETQLVRPVGSPDEIAIKVRVVAATNRNLRDEVKLGRFREDLFFRLQVVPMILPPLRERMEDLPLLTEHLLQRVAAGHPNGIPSVSPEAYGILSNYGWHGNVRELMNVLKRAILFATSPVLSGELVQEVLEGSIFRFTPSTPTNFAGHSAPAQAPTKARTLEEVEREHIDQLYNQLDGNVTHMAKALGIDRRTLQRKLRAYGYPPRAN